MIDSSHRASPGRKRDHQADPVFLTNAWGALGSSSLSSKRPRRGEDIGRCVFGEFRSGNASPVAPTLASHADAEWIAAVMEEHSKQRASVAQQQRSDPQRVTPSASTAVDPAHGNVSGGLLPPSSTSLLPPKSPDITPRSTSAKGNPLVINGKGPNLTSSSESSLLLSVIKEQREIIATLTAKNTLLKERMSQADDLVESARREAQSAKAQLNDERELWARERQDLVAAMMHKTNSLVEAMTRPQITTASNSIRSPYSPTLPSYDTHEAPSSPLKAVTFHHHPVDDHRGYQKMSILDVVKQVGFHSDAARQRALMLAYRLDHNGTPHMR